jgi:hypothetical protein
MRWSHLLSTNRPAGCAVLVLPCRIDRNGGLIPLPLPWHWRVQRVSDHLHLKKRVRTLGRTPTTLTVPPDRPRRPFRNAELRVQHHDATTLARTMTEDGR